MNLKSRIVFFSFIFWVAFCWHWYTCNIKGLCLICSSNKNETFDKFDSPFKFNKSSFLCIKGKEYKIYMDSLKTLVKDGNLLIIGFYNNSEINNSNFPNLGLARANSIKSILATEIDTSKVFTKSKLFDSELHQEPFIAHKIEKVIYETLKGTSEKYSLTTKKEIIADKNEEYVITFSTHSIKFKHTPEIDNYLDTMAKYLKTSGKILSIIGHTDGVEDKKLGRIRAWVVKSELLKRGVNSNQLITSSKGSSKPIHNNDTVKDNLKNSRVVIN
jgi:OOP family OmpA-OmpF porin